MEEGVLIVLEGCCIPRKHVLEQLTPRAIETVCLSVATAYIPEWQAALIIRLCVSVTDMSSECAHTYVCKCLLSTCASMCSSPSVYICVRWCVSIVGPTFY